jgi:hypothetical protein
VPVGGPSHLQTVVLDGALSEDAVLMAGLEGVAPDSGFAASAGDDGPAAKFGCSAKAKEADSPARTTTRVKILDCTIGLPD